MTLMTIWAIVKRLFQTTIWLARLAWTIYNTTNIVCVDRLPIGSIIFLKKEEDAETPCVLVNVSIKPISTWPGVCAAEHSFAMPVSASISIHQSKTPNPKAPFSFLLTIQIELPFTSTNSFFPSEIITIIHTGQRRRPRRLGTEQFYQLPPSRHHDDDITRNRNE
jgi:hypothetical protein